eukprot:gene18382-21920_t
MKIKLLSTALLLWLATGIAGCKKDNPNTLIVKLSGKWQVLKIETKTFNASGAVVTDNTVNYGVSDYLDFKNNESSDLEVSLAGTRQVGNYVVFLGTAFNLSLPSKHNRWFESQNNGNLVPETIKDPQWTLGKDLFKLLKNRGTLFAPNIEKKWQEFWAQNQTFKAEQNTSKPKFYVLDMFPYPSGAGLHVGHPLGYIASDIFSRYKRLKGFNVLHPMGYDSFGLPAEQYAIQTGQHPAITTEANINTYRRQLDQIGFSFDWSREVRTSEAGYYKWTQWIFMQLFNSWYNLETDRAEDITTLIEKFNASGSADVKAVCDEDTKVFLPSDWATMSPEEKQEELLKYRMTYLKESTVNWCPALGTVLANDEVKDGFSERGGYPVEQKKMMQWSMRISAYAERLLQGLNTIDWPEPVKEMQRNWIGKSVGASVKFNIEKTAENAGVQANYIE